MEIKEQEYRQVRKAARKANREAQKALEEQQRQINAQQHQLREEFKKRMKALHDMYNQPSKASRATESAKPTILSASLTRLSANGKPRTLTQSTPV